MGILVRECGNTLYPPHGQNQNHGFSFWFQFPFVLPVSKEKVILVSGKSGFSFWFQFCLREGVGVFLPPLILGAKKSTQTFFVQSFSKTLRVMDVRAENRGRPHQRVRFSAAPVMGRNFLTQGHPGVRVRNVRGKSGPKSLCLCCFSFLRFFLKPQPHIQGKYMNKTMAPELPNMPGFEELGVMFCLQMFVQIFALYVGGGGH